MSFLRINTANIDAIGGNDYGIVNRTITFTPGGGNVQSIPVTIDDDNIVEDNERFTATLTAGDGVIVPPDGATTIVTINDNDGGFCAYTFNGHQCMTGHLHYLY